MKTRLNAKLLSAKIKKQSVVDFGRYAGKIKILSNALAPKETNFLVSTYYEDINQDRHSMSLTVGYKAPYAKVQHDGLQKLGGKLRHLPNFRADNPWGKMSKIAPRKDKHGNMLKPTHAARYSRGYKLARKNNMLTNPIKNEFLKHAINAERRHFIKKYQENIKRHIMNITNNPLRKA